MSRFILLLSISLTYLKVCGDVIKLFGEEYSTDFDTKIELQSSTLTGTVPTTLGLLTRLVHFRVDFNQLSGSIPTQMGNLESIRSIRFDNNRLVGPIPSEFALFTDVYYIFLSNNHLSGTLPSELGLLVAMTELRLTGNQISGVIPSEYAGMLALQNLYFARNKLMGTFPSEIFLLHSLRQIDVEFNRLSGLIPSELAQVTKLNLLQLKGNRFSDELPDTISELTSMVTFTIDDNPGLAWIKETSFSAAVCEKITSCLRTKIVVTDCVCADPRPPTPSVTPTGTPSAPATMQRKKPLAYIPNVVRTSRAPYARAAGAGQRTNWIAFWPRIVVGLLFLGASIYVTLNRSSSTSAQVELEQESEEQSNLLEEAR
eukprot:c20631_g5_i3.p1 GENE.c20631_g5_i3~~c20631_g5_i3.p1  ORF type:complete len:372 (+),score=103.40 c20631_g5_i3:52-1167(+)